MDKVLNQLAIVREIKQDGKILAYSFVTLRNGTTVNVRNLDVTSAVVYASQWAEMNGVKGLVNFSIENGKIKQDAGSFKRLEGYENIKPVIILAEVHNEANRLVQYLCLDRTGRTARIPVKKMYEYCIKAKRTGERVKNEYLVYAVNGVFVESEDGCFIRSFSGHPFEQIKVELSDRAKLKKKGTQVDTKEGKKALDKKNEVFTKEQLKELKAAEKNGVKPVIIANPEFTPEQMRVIWQAKKKGVRAELFANPKYKVECMEFLAGIMGSGEPKRKEIEPLLSVKYSAGQMREIYWGIIKGVDYTSYMGYENTEADMRFLRMCLEKELGHL